MLAEIPFPLIDPVIVAIGPLQIRWYSMMYVVGFLLGHLILVRLARARFFPLPAERAADLVFWLVLGVMLGGRVGYCVFYRPELLLSWRVIAVWEGGLSFHGGLLGVVAAAVFFARRHRVSAWRLLDCLAIAVTPGVLAVRCANFINGELYGRITDASVRWAVRFPTDPVAMQLLGIAEGAGIRDRETLLREAVANGRWDAIRAAVPFRHPSQLYEALGEGLLVGIALWVAYAMSRRRPLGSGVYGALFALGYGAVRWVLEDYRQPDEQFRDANDPVGTVLVGMTMGQTLCTAMIVFGLGAIALRWRHRDGLRDDGSGAEAVRP